MIAKLFSLEYPLGEMENEYRKHYLPQDIRQTIVVGSIWLIPNLLFIYTDYLLFFGAPLFQTLVSIRIFLLSGLSIIFAFLRKVKQPVVYDYTVFIACLFALAGVFCINRLHSDLHTHTAGMDYLLLFSTYLLIPNKLLFRMIPALLFTLVNFFNHFMQPVPFSGPLLTIIGVSLVLSNVLGIWASIRFYSRRRQQYKAQVHAYELRKDLIQNASVDQLTGVSNRRYFYQAAEAEFERFIRYRRPFSVLMLDLDHFKHVNDQFGHPVGDKILKELAATITRCKRDTDILGRLGGEEFALLLPETNLSGATDIAVRLRRSCHGVSLPSTSKDRCITVSIGVTQARSGDANFDEVLARADETLYRAKNNGRDRVEVA
jgi:diguanylate cyclase (GGDEF)-like protein